MTVLRAFPRAYGPSDAAFQSPAAGLSAHTGIHLIDDHAYTSRDTFLSAHKDSSLPPVNSRFQRAFSPRPRGFIRADSLPVLGVRPFSTCTGIRQPAAADHLGSVPFSTRTGIRAGTAREGSDPFLPQHTDTYSVAEAHGQTGSPFSAHMQSVSRLVHRSTFLIFSATHGPMRRPTLLPIAFPCMCTGDDGIPATHRRAKPCAHARAMPTHGRTQHTPTCPCLSRMHGRWHVPAGHATVHAVPGRLS